MDEGRPIRPVGVHTSWDELARRNPFARNKLRKCVPTPLLTPFADRANGRDFPIFVATTVPASVYVNTKVRPARRTSNRNPVNHGSWASSRGGRFAACARDGACRPEAP